MDRQELSLMHLYAGLVRLDKDGKECHEPAEEEAAKWRSVRVLTARSTQSPLEAMSF